MECTISVRVPDNVAALDDALRLCSKLERIQANNVVRHALEVSR